MVGEAYVFYHPQYGGLRVIKTDDGLFFCIEDIVAITDINRDNLFPVLADTEGRLVEFHVAESTKKKTKSMNHRVFFSEDFGDGEKVKILHKNACRDMIFVDSQVVKDMTVGCSNELERKLFYKWVMDFIQPVMEDKNMRWRYACVLMEGVYYHPLAEPIDIRYAADGLYINNTRIN